jgi:putative ABC transport system permease protein
VLLHPLPVDGIGRVVTLRVDMPKLELFDTQMSPAEIVDWTKSTDVFEAFTGVSGGSMTLTGSRDARRVVVARTIGDFSTVFQLHLALGRFYETAASEPGRHRVAVLSHAMWRELFAGDPGVLGSSIVLNDSTYQVVGVMADDFRYPRSANLWMPYVLTPRAFEPTQRGTLIMTPIARMRAGITPERLREALHSELAAWEARFDSSRYGDESVYRLQPVPIVDFLSGELRPVLLTLLGAVVVVLFIACANIASLQLVRTTGRFREIAVRAALGAGRWSIVRQFLVESLALAMLGGVLGVALGVLALRVLSHWDGSEYQALRDVRLDAAVLGLTTGVTLLAGIVFGVAPAWRALQVNAHDALKANGSRSASLGAGRHRFLQVAVIAQVALTLVLLLGSGVMLRSLTRLLDTDPGFSAARTISMQITPPSARYPWARRAALYRQVMDRVQTVPGVESAAMTGTLPFSDMGLDSSPFSIPGAPPLPDEQQRHANAVPVTPEYFRTMGIALLRGRAFTDADGPDAQRVVIVDEQLANQYFPNENPVGRVIDHFGQGLTIVGVARSINESELGAPHKAVVYYPYYQMPFPSAGIVVRSTASLDMIASEVRRAVQSVDPLLPVYDVQAMPIRVERSLGARRLAVTVLGGFAGLALLLAMLGTYGVLSYSTSQRTRELGIRMALGAQPGDVVTMVLRNGLTLAAIGLATGIVVYLAIGSRVLAALVYGVGSRDPLTLVVGIALLTLAAAVACWIPARRAALVDPSVTLRVE